MTVKKSFPSHTDFFSVKLRSVLNFEFVNFSSKPKAFILTFPQLSFFVLIFVHQVNHFFVKILTPLEFTMLGIIKFCLKKLNRLNLSLKMFYFIFVTSSKLQNKAGPGLNIHGVCLLHNNREHIKWSVWWLPVAVSNKMKSDCRVRRIGLKAALFLQNSPLGVRF